MRPHASASEEAAREAPDRIQLGQGERKSRRGPGKDAHINCDRGPGKFRETDLEAVVSVL